MMNEVAAVCRGVCRGLWIGGAMFLSLSCGADLTAPPLPVALAQQSTYELVSLPGNPQRLVALHQGRSQIDLTITGKSPTLSDEAVIAWVQAAGLAVGEYFGRFPVERVAVNVSLTGRGRIRGGVTSPAGIRVRVGSGAALKDLAGDWVMTHEMFHLSFPMVDEQYEWFTEGRAVYLEPIARVRQGTISVEKYWSDLVEQLPQGQPSAGDAGLDHTHSWARTYWGGALFCFVADVRIREQTHNSRSLDDAMRAILERGGDHLAAWPVEQIIAIGDQATRTHVLRDLYAEMRDTAVRVDLEEMWRRLGVSYSGRRVTFDESAPLAEVRRSMTASPARAR